MVVVLFVLLASQVLVHLHATSVVTAAAYDAARIASGAQGSADEALAHARDLLGAWADDVSLHMTANDEQVVVDVRAQSPALLSRTLLGPIERRIVVRTERFRD